ncbi:MAG: hypothetical protein ACTSW3_04090 [Promethearchaeota archaeon]
MNKTKICNKCGHSSKIASRYCEKCGNPLFIELDSSNLREEKLIDIFNSLYNLICDKSNSERKQYISSLSEKVIFDRNKRIFKDYAKNISILKSMSGSNPFDLNLSPLIQSTSSNVLSGYTFRVAEELHTGKKSDNLDIKEIEKIIIEYLEAGKKAIGDEFLWYKSDIKSPLIKREILSTALLRDNKYLSFTLLDEENIKSWLSHIMNGNFKRHIKTIERLYNNIYGSPQVAKNLVSNNQEKYGNDVIEDVIFGYCLRLSESLMPY